jgi:hypothetical protein
MLLLLPCSSSVALRMVFCPRFLPPRNSRYREMTLSHPGAPFSFAAASASYMAALLAASVAMLLQLHAEKRKPFPNEPEVSVVVGSRS